MVADNVVEEVPVLTAEAITCPTVDCTTPESAIPATIAPDSPVVGNVAVMVKEPVLAGRLALNM